MIELNTGVPGSGKTLGMVERLSKLQAKWSAHPEDARPVFVLGVPDLLLPHALVPLKSVQINKAGAPSLVPDWAAMPDGSLVIIDEAQGCFPPRSSASSSPEHVAWLNTHRHHGFDIWLTTQHPKLIDGTVRALVGKHQHYRRMFGGARAVVYEWDACSDSLSGLKTAVTSYYSYPKSVFKFYKSAEIHTKQSFKLPLWLAIPVIGLIMGAYFIPKAGFTLSRAMSGKGLHEDSTSPLSSVTSPVSPVRPVAALAATGTAGGSADHVPDTALISACLVSVSGRCQCYNHNGIHISLSQEDCLNNANAPSSAWRLNSSVERPDVSRPVQTAAADAVNVDSSRWVFSDSPQVPSLR